MAKAQAPKPKSPAQLEAEVQALLEQTLDDRTLRDRLEDLASEQAFGGLTYLWGPVLYQRSRVMFRPFILNHFDTMSRIGWDWRPVKWKSHAKTLGAWLEEADRRDDVDLFRRLYAWKHGTSEWGGLDEKTWRKDLLAHFQAAKERHERSIVFQKFDQRSVTLDEATAVALYQADPVAAGPFLLKHAPDESRSSGKRKLPQKLMEALHANRDEKTYFALYRKMVTPKAWEADIQALAKTVADPAVLVAELEKRHPESVWDFDMTGGFHKLALARGREVVPYLMKHMDAIWVYWGYGQKGVNKLLEHARKEGWWDVWGILVRKGSHENYNREVLDLVKDTKTPEELVFRRLLTLSGASSEWNFGRFAWEHVQSLTDAVALALVERFPDLVHGPFRPHVSISGWQTTSLPKFTKRVLQKDDHVMIDHLASQTLTLGRWSWPDERLGGIKPLLEYFQSLQKDAVSFATRVASVLGRLPAYSIGSSYHAIVKNNALTRLFFVESESALLDNAAAVRDLLEAVEIQSQMLAVRVLSRDDDRARALANQNLDVLAPMLLRPLHRQSRIVVFKALANAAVSTEAARLIRDRARDALQLPEEGYPREHLLTLLAELQERYPELQTENEKPRVFASKKRRSKWAVSR